MTKNEIFVSDIMHSKELFDKFMFSKIIYHGGIAFFSLVLAVLCFYIIKKYFYNTDKSAKTLGSYNIPVMLLLCSLFVVFSFSLAINVHWILQLLIFPYEYVLQYL